MYIIDNSLKVKEVLYKLTERGTVKHVYNELQETVVIKTVRSIAITNIW